MGRYQWGYKFHVPSAKVSCRPRREPTWVEGPVQMETEHLQRFSTSIQQRLRPRHVTQLNGSEPHPSKRGHDMLIYQALECQFASQ